MRRPLPRPVNRRRDWCRFSPFFPFFKDLWRHPQRLPGQCNTVTRASVYASRDAVSGMIAFECREGTNVLLLSGVNTQI